eukprot:gene31557-38977_t
MSQVMVMEVSHDDYRSEFQNFEGYTQTGYHGPLQMQYSEDHGQMLQNFTDIYEELCRTTIAEFGSFAYESAGPSTVNEIEHEETTNTNNKREIHVNVIGLPVRIQVIEKSQVLLGSGGFSSENINFWDGDSAKREALIKQVEQRAVSTMHTTPQPVIPHSNYKITINPENEINTCLLMVQLLKESVSTIDIHRSSQLIPYNLSVYLAGSNSKDIYDLRTLKSSNKPQVVTQNNPTIGNRYYNTSTTPEAVKSSVQWDTSVAHARAHLQWIKESGADVSQYEYYLFNKPTHPDVPYEEFMELHSMPSYPHVESSPSDLIKHLERGEKTISHPSVMSLNNPTMGGVTHNAALSHHSTKTPEQWYMEAAGLISEHNQDIKPSVATVTPKYNFPARAATSRVPLSEPPKSKLIAELLEAAGAISTEEDGSYSMDMGDFAPLQRVSSGSSSYTSNVKVKTDPHPSGMRQRPQEISASRSMTTESLLDGQMKEMYTSVRSDMPVSLHMVSDVTMSFDSSMLNNPFEDISMNTVSHALRPVITNTALLTSFHEAETAMISALSTVNITDWTAKELQDAEDKRILSLLGETQSFPMISQATRIGMMNTKTKL